MAINISYLVNGKYAQNAVHNHLITLALCWLAMPSQLKKLAEVSSSCVQPTTLFPPTASIEKGNISAMLTQFWEYSDFPIHVAKRPGTKGPKEPFTNDFS